LNRINIALPNENVIMDGLNNQGKGQVLNMERRTQLLKYGALLLAIQAGLVIAAGAAPTARVNV
jgi:hypothetical protein